MTLSSCLELIFSLYLVRVIYSWSNLTNDPFRFRKRG